MSKEFHDAEMALFMEQAKDVDIIITTVRFATYLDSIMVSKNVVPQALIPGKPAPKLITNEVRYGFDHIYLWMTNFALDGGGHEARFGHCRFGSRGWW